MEDDIFQDFEMVGQTGFQSATNEYGVERLSLDALFGLKAPSILLRRATQNFEGRNFRISAGDIIIIDKKLNKPQNNKLFAVIGNGDFYIGEYAIIQNKPYLKPLMIPLSNEFESDYEIIGGIVAIINIYSEVVCPEDEISLDRVFSLKAPNIYLWRAEGSIGRKFQIKNEDIVIVDRQLYKLKPESLYVFIEGKDFQLSQYSHIQFKPFLVPQMIPIQDISKIEDKIWGGIVAIINIHSKPEGLG
jgi:hypothetical protein